MAKIAIYIRIDDDVLAFFKEDGPEYQTRINRVLRENFTMAEKRVEDFAYKHGLSHSAAKRRMKRHKKPHANLPQRGTPVAGTGKPKGAKKG